MLLVCFLVTCPPTIIDTLVTGNHHHHPSSLCLYLAACHSLKESCKRFLRRITNFSLRYFPTTSSSSILPASLSISLPLTHSRQMTPAATTISVSVQANTQIQKYTETHIDTRAHTYLRQMVCTRTTFKFCIELQTLCDSADLRLTESTQQIYQTIKALPNIYLSYILSSHKDGDNTGLGLGSRSQPI